MKNQNLFLIIFLSFNLFSEIHEKNTIKAVHDHVYVEIKESESKNIIDSSSTIVVLDLDNTTFKPKNSHHGGDAWFSASINHLQKEHELDFANALSLVLPEYINIQKESAVEPVEKEIVEFISKFQKDKIPVIALTARSMPLEETTLKQLKSINIDFSHNCLAGKKDITFHNLEHSCKYTNGILFVSDNDKGKALTVFLDHVKHGPKKVVYADDKLKHAQHVERACQAKNIEAVCIRYGLLDEEVKNYKLPEETKTKLSGKVKKDKSKVSGK